MKGRLGAHSGLGTYIAFLEERDCRVLGGGQQKRVGIQQQDRFTKRPISDDGGWSRRGGERVMTHSRIRSERGAYSDFRTGRTAHPLAPLSTL